MVHSSNFNALANQTAWLIRNQGEKAGSRANSWNVASGAILRSYGDDNIDGNADGDPAPTTIAKK